MLRNDDLSWTMIFSTRGSSNRISRRNSTKKNRDSNSSNRLSGMSFDGEIIPEGTNSKILPTFDSEILKFRVWVNNLGRDFWLMKKIVMFQFHQNVQTRQWVIYRRFPVKDLLKRSLIFRKNLIPLLIYRSQRKERRQHYRGRVRKQR